MLSTVVTPLIQNNALAWGEREVYYYTGSKDGKSDGSEIAHRTDSDKKFRGLYDSSSIQGILDASGANTSDAKNIIKDGYIFAGWKNKNGGTVYQPGDSVSSAGGSGRINVVAQWTDAKHAVSINDSAATANTEVEIKDDETVAGTIKYGYIINGLTDQWGRAKEKPEVTSVDVKFTVSPKASNGYALDEFTIGGEAKSLTQQGTYTVSDVKADLAAAVSFKKLEYSFGIILVDTDDGVEAIDPDEATTVFWGDDETVTVTLKEGYEITGVKRNGFPIYGLVITDGAFTVPEIKQNTTIEITVNIKKYAIKAYVAESEYSSHASIKDTTSRTINYGSDTTFELNVDDGYYIASVLIDRDEGEDLTIPLEEKSYTLEDVTENANLYFNIEKYNTVTATVDGEHGEIEPKGANLVRQGASISFTITPDDYYALSSITVDGIPANFTGNTFTINDVREDYNVVVKFVPIEFHLIVETDEGGEVSINEDTITYETDEEIAVAALPGYHIAEIDVNDEDKTENLDEEGIFHLSGVTCDTVVHVYIEADEYEVLEGDDQVFNAESEDNLVIRFSGDYELFEKLYIDGKEVPEEKYTAESGSTVVTVKHDYLVSLGNGAHDIKALYTNGNYASADFEIYGIPEAPNTGLFQMKTENAGVNASFAAAMIAALATLVVFRRKKAAKNA